MVERNIHQVFRLENVDETRVYLTEEINRNELMSKKRKKICATLNYNEDFLILGSNNYWMYFNFCSCFFSWYSNKNYEFRNSIKNLYNNCSY